jgi:hypothetical protein
MVAGAPCRAPKHANSVAPACKGASDDGFGSREASGCSSILLFILSWVKIAAGRASLKLSGM